MEESKRREIEKKLRQLLMAEDSTPNENQQADSRLIGARVIRRRKGSPDMRIS